MKELWGFIAPVNLGGSNSSRRLPTWEVLLTRSLQGAETPPPRDKFGGVGGDAKKRPGGLVCGVERVWGNSQWVCSLATLRERGADLPRAQLHTSIPPPC